MRPRFDFPSPSRTTFLLAGFALAILGAAPLKAQLAVELIAEKREFVAYEPVRMQVSITNQSSNPILLGTPGGHLDSWLKIDVTTENGELLHPGRPPQQIDPTQIRPGQNIRINFDLGLIAPITRFGAYSVRAGVWTPPDSAYTQSNSLRINIVNARTIWSQAFGVPHGREGGGESRIFNIQQYRGFDGGTLYLRLDERGTGRVLACYPIGPALEQREPSFALDGGANLHALFLTTPAFYRHLVFDPDGRITENRLYTEVANQRPRLAQDIDGSLLVQGGRPYDPQVAHDARITVRRVSERPPGVAGPARRTPGALPDPANPATPLPQLDPLYEGIDP